MIKYFTTLQNERGDVLPSYRAQVTDSAGSVVTIYADKGGTRFTDASGNNVNYATADERGRVSFYFTPAVGQILQTLDIAGNLLPGSEADFADSLVLDELSGEIAQSSVTDLVTDLGNKTATADLASTDAAKGVDLVAGAAKKIATRTAMKALTAAGDKARPLNLTETGREGIFIWDASVTIATHQADTREGIYIAPDAGSNGAWVRQYRGAGVADWFGAVADFNTGSSTGTDNKAAIEAALAVCKSCVLKPGRYGVASKLTIGQNQHLLVEGTPADTRIQPTTGFSDDAVIELNATRSFATRVQVEVPTAIYDPVANTGTQISCFKTSGSVYHQHLTDCRAVGGYRSAWVTAFETKLTRFQGDNSYDGIYVEQYDCSLHNVTTNNSTRYGLYTTKGIEGNDIHLVRSGDTGAYFSGGLPIMLSGLYIDTPTKDGVTFDNTNGARIDGIFFTKMGEGRASPASHDCRYFVFKKSRHNDLGGGSINIQNDGSTIDTTGHYFASYDDGVTISNEYERSIGNAFRNFRTSGIVIAKDATQRKFATWQKWLNCHNTAGRYNNEGLVYRGDQEFIAASGTTTLKFYIQDIDRAAAGRFAGLRGEWVARTGTGNRAAGTCFIPLAQAGDTGSKDGVVTTDYSVGTAPTFTLTGVNVTVSTNGSRNTMYVEVTVTNTSASSGTFSLAFRAPLDNQGPD